MDGAAICIIYHFGGCSCPPFSWSLAQSVKHAAVYLTLSFFMKDIVNSKQKGNITEL